MSGMSRCPWISRTAKPPRSAARRAGQQRAGAALHHGPSAQHCRRRAGGCWNAGWRGGSWRGGNGGAGRGHRRRRSLRPCARHGLGAGEHALPAPAGQRGRGRERRHSASALHAAAPQAAAPPRSPASACRRSPTIRLNPVALPLSQPSSRAWRETLRLLKKNARFCTAFGNKMLFGLD